MRESVEVKEARDVADHKGPPHSDSAVHEFELGHSVEVETFREIQFYSHSANVFKNIPHWGDLRLDELKELNVMFCLRQYVLNRSDSHLYVRNFINEHPAVTKLLLRMSSSTIQDLTVDLNSSNNIHLLMVILTFRHANKGFISLSL